MHDFWKLWNFWQFCDRWPMAAADQSATWWLLTKYMCGSQHSQFTIWSSMWIFLLIEIVMESVDWMKLEIGWYHQICLKKSQVFTSCLNYWCAPNPMLLPLGFSLILTHSRPTPCHPRNLHKFSSKSDGSSFMLSVQNLKWVMFDKWYKFNLFCCSSCQ